MKNFEYFDNEVHRLIDRLKYPVDENIKHVVAALRYAGFYTEASCEGHDVRGRNYPWVRFRDSNKTREKIEPLLKQFNEIQKCNLMFDGTELLPSNITDLDSMRRDMNAFADWLIAKGGDPENEIVAITFDF